MIENIEDNRNGFLFTPGDRLDLTIELKTLIEDSTLRQKMGARAIISVNEYSWKQSIQNLVNIWQEQIDKQLTINNEQLTVHSFEF